MSLAALGLDNFTPPTTLTLAPYTAGPSGFLLSPFQEKPDKMLSHHSPCSSRPTSVSALSFETCSSRSRSSSSSGCNSSAMETCHSRRASAYCESIDPADVLGHCFCGQSIQTINSDDDEDIAIYCSAQCARKDALHALLGGDASDECDPRHLSLLTAHHQARRTSTQRDSVSTAHGEQGSATSHDPHPVTNASMALQKVTKMDEMTHYRRMGAMRARRCSYPSEIFEEVYLTPTSAPSVLCEESDDQSSGEDSDSEQSSVTTTSDVERRAQRHIISLPPVPLLDVDAAEDDDEESVRRRNRHKEIESELRELDALLAEQLQAFSLPNGDHSKELDEEDDVLMSITSPLLDYEAPLGWRNSTRIYSSNYLGLHLGQESPAARSDDSDRAMCEHIESHLGWQWSAMSDEQHNAPSKRQDPLYIPTALELARELAYVQATYHTGSPPTKELFTNPFASTAMSRDASTGSSVLTVTPEEEETYVEPIPKPRQRSNTLRTLPSKRNLYHFFSRRPSEPTISSASTKGISSADLALTPHLAPRSVPPRFSSLTSSVPMRRMR